MGARDVSEGGLGVLGDAGDLYAPPGSRPWAVAVRIELQATLADMNGDADHLRRMYRLMSEHEGYRQLTDGQDRPFTSWRAFCQARQPFGLGMPPEMIEALISERRTAQELAQKALPLTEHGEIGNGRSRDDTIMSTPATQGTSADYLTARIARDHKDILERMKAGEFKSVRAAALEAGIVKKTVQVPLDSPSAARKLAKHFDVVELVAALQAQITSQP